MFLVTDSTEFFGLIQLFTRLLALKSQALKLADKAVRSIIISWYRYIVQEILNEEHN
jgi:hypothetical protein